MRVEVFSFATSRYEKQAILSHRTLTSNAPRCPRASRLHTIPTKQLRDRTHARWSASRTAPATKPRAVFLPVRLGTGSGQCRTESQLALFLQRHRITGISNVTKIDHTMSIPPHHEVARHRSPSHTEQSGYYYSRNRPSGTAIALPLVRLSLTKTSPASVETLIATFRINHFNAFHKKTNLPVDGYIGGRCSGS